jgi:integrase
MPRHATNELTIAPLPGGRYQLQGRILGRLIRRRSKDYNELATLKESKEREYREQVGRLADEPLTRTRMTPAQVADAEAAIRALVGNRSLLYCVHYANKHAPPVDDIGCAFALAEWVKTLKARKRSERTEDKNVRRVEDFIESARVVHLSEITPLAIEKYVLRPGPADYTRLTDAQVIRAWLNFCVKRRWLTVSPFEIDMADLSATARPKEHGRILTPEQCHALLAAARSHARGLLVPYTILTTWCFMRDSEARRITRDKMRLNAATPVIEVDTKKRRTAKYRTVTVPANVVRLLRGAVGKWPRVDDDGKPFTVPFTRAAWSMVREKAGIIVRKAATSGKRRPVINSYWQADITRHTGISYLFQRCGDITEVCRQAGNKSDVSFRHYLTLPLEGAADRFYSKPC